eukprot:CAMPEP_0184693882 /NCGR_PEP_ID=MMETSP0313-20130426/2000_1 /TAXON_ID=2792 /ORGANISM="Porphyridium aerugineum, Strain SAG 1380-2" /LENGTH=515 /DNA_ID=CAMNT_0027152057 /DNA_START=790 /DNA_END=2337 /DNA_ORIENTATION=+
MAFSMKTIMDQVIPRAGVHRDLVTVLNPEVAPKPTLKTTSAPANTSEYVLYWMSSTARTEQNPSYEIAKALANFAKLPLVVAFVVDLNRFQRFSKRHILFLLQGVQEVETGVKGEGGSFVLKFDPKEKETGVGGLNLLGSVDGSIIGYTSKAWAIVADKVYVRDDRIRAERVLKAAGCPYIEVESKLVVPLQVAMGDMTPEHFPETQVFLEKFHDLAQPYLKPQVSMPLENKATPELEKRISKMGYCFDEDGVTATWGVKDWLETKDILESLLDMNGVNVQIPDVAHSMKGGYHSAKKLVGMFIVKKFKGYSNKLSQEGLRLRSEYGSMLSNYLTHGFISPVEVLLDCVKSSPTDEDLNAFFKSIGRRDLAFAYVYYHMETYDQFASVSEATVKQLTKRGEAKTHKYYYTTEEWETGNTHDENWNSVQKELIFRGRDIAQDRSFWCYKVIDYEVDPKNAWNLALYLNDRYMLDADSIGFINIRECFEEFARLTSDDDDVSSATKKLSQKLNISKV